LGSPKGAFSIAKSIVPPTDTAQHGIITAQFYGHVKAEHTTQAAESFDRLAAGVGT